MQIIKVIGGKASKMESKEYWELEVNSAVKHAVSWVVASKASNCKDYKAAEGREVVEYLKECKKRISDELDEAIKFFEDWR